MPRQEADYVVSSGNVFADLGLPNPEEALAKAELANKIPAACGPVPVTFSAQNEGATGPWLLGTGDGSAPLPFILPGKKHLCPIHRGFIAMNGR